MDSKFIEVKRKLLTMQTEAEQLGLGHERLDKAVTQFDKLTAQIMGAPICCVDTLPIKADMEFSVLSEVRGLYHEVSFALEALGASYGEGMHEVQLELHMWQRDFVHAILEKRKSYRSD